MSTKTVSFKADEKHIKKMDEIVEERGYTSRGEFLREILRNNLEPVLTERAKKEIEKGREQIEKGKSISLEELKG